MRAILGGWQLNGIATHNSGTPFTVSDSANVALQANSPPISGFPASRPNLVGDPNAGPHTVNEWLSRSAFQRLSIATQAGQFGNAGRNIARGPSFTNVDVSLVRDFQLGSETRLQFRAEVFNVANHANFGLPVADLNSVNFGRIFSAGAAAADAVRAQADLLVTPVSVTSLTRSSQRSRGAERFFQKTLCALGLSAPSARDVRDREPCR